MRALNSQDFALLSDHIYGKKDENGEKKLVFDNEKNKEITLNGIKYTVEKISNNPQNGYFGAIYRRLDTNELVVVHRGTEFETRQDREADMRMVKDHTNPQYNDARALTEVANAMAKHNGAKIYQTGHSLGGALAQLCGNRYGQRTETFNAFGAAGLKEALPINPLADRLIINHRMGGDYVSSASNHLGRSILYTTKNEVDNLRKGGFATQDTSDDNFLANKWNLYSSHAINNFTSEKGLSVLSPHSPAHQLAEENMAMLSRFNNLVKEKIRQSPQAFEKYINWADKFIAENQQQYLNPYEQQNRSQYAFLDPQINASKLQNISPETQKLFNTAMVHLTTYHKTNNLSIDEEKLQNSAMALTSLALSKNITDLTLFSVKNDQYLIGNRNPTLNLASMDIGLSASIPVEKSFNQIQQTAQLSEYEEQQKQLAQSQSRGMSIG
ncbi:Mbeg1-like protein [Neisseria sp. P0019.S003]|uniref:Mbeg1-like protein n=1 Tax=Neisseria sp. P0019.S003 TaxID=3436799 RepID=UPI003F81F3DC